MPLTIGESHQLVAEHLDECDILHPSVLITHYIDDILIQASTEDSVRYCLEQIVEHLKKKGWEINPDKIQGPAQEVKFLGIHWNFGHRAVLPKAQQKILYFAPPQNKKEAQKCIGLFGCWRNHIPHLGQVLQPLYRVTMKKYEFDWGAEQDKAFEAAQAAIQAALDLWPIREGPLELMVTVNAGYANWSLWQKQDAKRVPLGFWARKLPEAGQSYTPFEQQLLAAYWELTETES